MEEEENDDEISSEYGESSEENSARVENEDGTTNDDLTYVHIIQSMHGVTPEASEEDDEDGTYSVKNNNQSGYDLRPLSRVNYSMCTLPEEISTDDEPKVNVAMKSEEKELWQAAIDE